MQSFPVSIRTNQRQNLAPTRSMWYERGVEGGTGTLIEPQRQPGIMIFNWKAETFYQNQEALEIMGALAGKDPAFSPAPGSSLPRIIVEIYTEFKTWEARNQDQAEGMIRFDIREYDLDGALYQLLPVLMQPQWNESRATQLLILIERVFKKPGLTRREKSIRLTPRERSVVQLLSEGMTNKEVANDLHIGEYTVKGYIKQIMKKLNVTTRAAIVAKSFSNSRDLNFGSTGDRPRAGDPPVPKSA